MESMNDAEKSLIHISHLHPLKLVASPEPKPICHACNIPCANQSFGCIKCRYYLHTTCATTKQSVDHPGHTAHTLALELTPTYYTGKFQCNACGDEGNTFCLKCKECDYDLHLHCAALPHRLNHPLHDHPLCLAYENPYPPNCTAICSMCKTELDFSKWFYLCRSCDIGGHVACFAPETVEAISPGLQVPPTLPVPQPQAPTLVDYVTENNNLQIQIMTAQTQAAQSMLAVNAMRMQMPTRTFHFSSDNIRDSI